MIGTDEKDKFDAMDFATLTSVEDIVVVDMSRCRHSGHSTTGQ